MSQAAASPASAVAPDANRARIVTLARKRFVEHGFARVSVEELCAELGIAKKTFYKQFANKGELVEALVADSLVRWLPHLYELERQDGVADERVTAAMSRLFELSTREFSAVFLRDIKVGLPALWERLEHGRQHLARQLARLIERGQRDGSYRRDVDGAQLAILIRLVVEHVLEPATMHAAGLHPASAGALLFELIRSGLRAPAGIRKRGGKTS